MLEFNNMRLGSGERQLQVAARLGGENVPILCQSSQLSNPAIAFNYQGETYYIKLVTTTNKSASGVRIRIGGTTYAIAKDSVTLRTAEDYLVSYLKFDESPTKDEYDNTWEPLRISTSYYYPSLSTAQVKFGTNSIYFNGKNSIQTTIDLGGQDFTIDGWFYMTAEQAWARTFELYIDGLGYETITASTTMYYHIGGVGASTYPCMNVWSHAAMVYSHGESKIRYFINGNCLSTQSKIIPRGNYQFAVGASTTKTGDGTPQSRMTGYAEFVRVYDGIARWSENFTPPTADDYN